MTSGEKISSPKEELCTLVSLEKALLVSSDFCVRYTLRKGSINFCEVTHYVERQTSYCVFPFKIFEATNLPGFLGLGYYVSIFSESHLWKWSHSFVIKKVLSIKLSEEKIKYCLAFKVNENKNL